MKNKFIKLLALITCVSIAVFVLSCKNKKGSSEEGVVYTPSKGLEYLLNEDGLSYSVVGVGDCEDTVLVIPEAYNELPITKIAEDAFANCDSLKCIVISGSITEIGDYAFCLCYGLTKIEVSKNNTAYKSIDGNLYTKDGKTLIQYAIGKANAKFTVPSSVEKIGYMAFYDCDNLASVNIGNSVTVIEARAFDSCSNLTSATIGNGVLSIGERAFSSCDSLTSIEMGNSVSAIGDEAFYYCTSLISVKMTSVQTIGKEAFYWCYSLESVELGENLTSIGARAFEFCSALTSVYYTGSAFRWNGISIGPNNERLTNAKRYYV